MIRDYTKWILVDFGMGARLNISQRSGGFNKGSIYLDEDDLKDIIKFVIEEGFLDWDCSECPIP